MRWNRANEYPGRIWWGCLAVLAACHLLSAPALATRIRDVARLSNEAPNELVGMGLVVGLHGTGDGGDYLPAMRSLEAAMRKFDQQVMGEKELKNAGNVAIVSISVRVPEQGAHQGDKLDIRISAVGAAKSLKGGRLFMSRLLAPDPNRRIILGHASGDVLVEDDALPTQGLIKAGGILDADILPEEIGDRFTLVLRPNTATAEMATIVADQINEDVSPQTGGRAVAKAVDATSVDVLIPKAELVNKTAFIARIRSLPLPNVPGPAKVLINTKTKTIVFTEEVELAPTMISHGGLTITVTAPNQNPLPPGSTASFIALDPHRQGMAKLKDLEAAFNLLKVGPDDRIAIVKLLHETNVLKCDLEIE
jgi:flagellar P-ring protein precursor FlgI